MEAADPGGVLAAAVRRKLVPSPRPPPGSPMASRHNAALISSPASPRPAAAPVESPEAAPAPGAARRAQTALLRSTPAALARTLSAGERQRRAQAYGVQRAEGEAALTLEAELQGVQGQIESLTRAAARGRKNSGARRHSLAAIPLQHGGRARPAPTRRPPAAAAPRRSAGVTHAVSPNTARAQGERTVAAAKRDRVRRASAPTVGSPPTAAAGRRRASIAAPSGLAGIAEEQPAEPAAAESEHGFLRRAVELSVREGGSLVEKTARNFGVLTYRAAMWSEVMRRGTH